MNHFSPPEVLKIRWLMHRDLPRVVEIESESFAEPYSEQDFKEFYRRREGVIVVAETDGGIEGFCAYELLCDRIRIVDIAVTPASRRLGVGSRMVEHLVGKAATGTKGRRIEAVVCEENLRGHLFFKSQGFRATGVVRDYFRDGQDGYAFSRHVPFGDTRKGK